jgi:hypothetical protein
MQPSGIAHLTHIVRTVPIDPGRRPRWWCLAWPNQARERQLDRPEIRRRATSLTVEDHPPGDTHRRLELKDDVRVGVADIYADLCPPSHRRHTLRARVERRVYRAEDVLIRRRILKPERSIGFPWRSSPSATATFTA